MRAHFKALFVVAAMVFGGLAHAAGPSYTNSDITNLNNAESNQKNTRVHGYKQGGGRCVFDPSATSGDRTIAAHGCGLVIPKGAVVTFAAYKVLTTFTSSTDAATIAVSIVGANDVVSAIAISNGGNPWDAAVAQETVPKVETS